MSQLNIYFLQLSTGQQLMLLHDSYKTSDFKKITKEIMDKLKTKDDEEEYVHVTSRFYKKLCDEYKKFGFKKPSLKICNYSIEQLDVW